MSLENNPFSPEPLLLGGSLDIDWFEAVIRTEDHHPLVWRPLCMSSAFSASSMRWRRFQKSAHRSPFSSNLSKIVFRLKRSGRRLDRNSCGSTGADTGALANARTEYG